MSRLTSLFVLFLGMLTLQSAGQTATIPVVFHVVYQNAAQNLHDSILQEQMVVLNNDLNATNSDIWKVPAVWQPLIGSMNVSFVFATTDPQGNPTTGIERRQTTTPSFSTNDNVKHFNSGGLDAWPDTAYLNIWVCNLTPGLNGYTQFPGGPDATDGIVLDYQVIGVGSPAIAPFNAGRTATHEVGHWLGLRHMGPHSSCMDIDSCADTPSFDTTISGTYPVGTILTDACTPTAPGIMWMNFMSYVDDTAMVFFTQDQIGKMTWYLNNMRQGFITDVNHGEAAVNDRYTVFPTPSANGIFYITRSDAGTNASVEVYDLQGRMICTPMQFLAGNTMLQLNLSSFAEGTYTLVIRNEQATESKRIIIAH